MLYNILRATQLAVRSMLYAATFTRYKLPSWSIIYA